MTNVPDPRRPPMFALSLPDDSEFELPVEWEDVFVDYFGPNPAFHPQVAERLVYVTGKYVEHRAWPSKFDGIGFEIESDLRYDDPDFYWEHWDEWEEAGLQWGNRTIHVPPNWAEVAEAVLYQQMRPGILQKILQQMAEETGRPAPRVVTPEQLLRELEADQPADSTTDPSPG
jgi:hypothetical protein